MKRLLISIAALLVFLSAGAGTITKNFVNLKKFTGVQICNAFRATLVQGDDYKAVVTIDTDYEEYLDVSVVGTVLYVRLKENGLKGNIRLLGKKKLLVTITCPELNQIYLTGSALLASDDLWTSPMETFTLDLSGAAKADNLRIEGSCLKAIVEGSSNATVTGDFSTVEVGIGGSSALFLVGNYEEVKVDAAGSSKMSFIGTADYLECQCKGSSFLDAMELKTSDAIIRCNGASKSTIFVRESLDVELKGASSCQYRSDSESLNVIPDISRASSFKRLH
ncbi:MAG: DUF2807 domain-containing protein [Bacteroidales bacterium]|nr:DUF2807 domain-containing protein [Bacteroidales bacterium]